MNQSAESNHATAWPYFVAALAAVGLTVLILFLIFQGIRPMDPLESRAQVRRQNRAELLALEQQGLTNYTVLDEANGVYQLPVERAMEIVAAEWQDPGAGRQKLLGRLAVMNSSIEKADESDFE